MADVAAAERGGYPPRRTAERGDLPDRAVLSRRIRRHVVDQGARIRRPARLLVIGFVMSNLQRCAASEQAEPDLTPAGGTGHERNGLAVR